MSETIDKLVKGAGDALLAAVWQEANTFGEHTAEALDTLLNGPENSREALEEIMELTGKDMVSVMMGALQHTAHVIEREQAAAEYIKARRLQADLEAEQATPSQDGEPTFEDQVKAERLRQIEKGYDAEHDDRHGLMHLTRVKLIYPLDSVKRAAMEQAISDWHDRRAAERGDGPEEDEDELLDF